jgi:ApbE superfamily uncharacterized protein (UPF0280 family)
VAAAQGIAVTRASARMLDGRRLHLQDGPIDLIIEASGPTGVVRAAYAAATLRFATILDELCAELPLLRSPAATERVPEGRVARCMWGAVLPFAAETFVTPMAAVAGAVADAVLGVMVAGGGLSRACVNNGGDIALHLAPGAAWRIGLVDRPDRPSLFAAATLAHGDGVAGIATSGWRGRSFSLGIADAVTVLAADAASADAAATIIANAVDLPGHPAMTRVPAVALQPDSDLGDRLVTRGVGRLTPTEIERALAAGVGAAGRLARRGLIVAAALHLAGMTRVVGQPGRLAVPVPASRRTLKLAKLSRESDDPRRAVNQTTPSSSSDLIGGLSGESWADNAGGASPLIVARHRVDRGGQP